MWLFLILFVSLTVHSVQVDLTITPFIDLPHEALQNIAFELDIKSFHALARTCRKMSDICHIDRSIIDGQIVKAQMALNLGEYKVKLKEYLRNRLIMRWKVGVLSDSTDVFNLLLRLTYAVADAEHNLMVNPGAKYFSKEFTTELMDISSVPFNPNSTELSSTKIGFTLFKRSKVLVKNFKLELERNIVLRRLFRHKLVQQKVILLLERIIFGEVALQERISRMSNFVLFGNMGVTWAMEQYLAYISQYEKIIERYLQSPIYPHKEGFPFVEFEGTFYYLEVTADNEVFFKKSRETPDISSSIPIETLDTSYIRLMEARIRQIKALEDNGLLTLSKVDREFWLRFPRSFVHFADVTFLGLKFSFLFSTIVSIIRYNFEPDHPDKDYASNLAGLWGIKVFLFLVTLLLILNFILPFQDFVIKDVPKFPQYKLDRFIEEQNATQQAS